MDQSDGNNDQLSIRKQIAEIRAAIANFRAERTGIHEASAATRKRYEAALAAYRKTHTVPTTANRYYLLRSAYRDRLIRNLDVMIAAEKSLPENTLELVHRYVMDLYGNWYSPADYRAMIRRLEGQQRQEAKNHYAKILDDQARALEKHSAHAADGVPPILIGKVGYERGHIKWTNEGNAQPHSRKHAIKKLPDDWRDKVLDRVFSDRAKTKYAHAILVQHYTGCRPEELRRGIKVTKGGSDGEYILTIETAKMRTNEKVERSYAVKDDRFDGLDKISIDSTLAYRKAISRIGKMTLGEDTSLAPYDYRQQAGADLKSAGASSHEVAQFLGHATDGNARHYGQASSGGGRDPRADARVTSGREVATVRGNSLESLKGKAREVARNITKR